MRDRVDVVVSVVSVTQRTVSLPTRCPACGSDWTREGGLVRYDVREERSRALLLPGESYVAVLEEDADATDLGASVAVCADVGCGQCAWMLSEFMAGAVGGVRTRNGTRPRAGRGRRG